MSETEASITDRGAEMRRRHRIQRFVGACVGPLWIPLASLVLRFGFGYRLAEATRVRNEFRAIRERTQGPMLICANHLTLVDSFLIAWALAPGRYYATHFDALPWNTPEETNFANTTRSRMLVYLAKCIPIRRGGSREDVAEVLDRIRYLLERGELALLFPEGGRSRTGRIAVENAAWGVGRIVGSVPGCQVLCVYMRGHTQADWSDYPARGDEMRVSLRCIEPQSEARGARRARDLAQQIIEELVSMEEEHLRLHPDLAERLAAGDPAEPEAGASAAPLDAGLEAEVGR